MSEFNDSIYRLRPWYHDFSALGVQTDFSKLPGGPSQNRDQMKQQARKERVIAPYITKALRELDRAGKTLTVLDLFCADGYYGLLVQKLSPDAVLVGVDSNPEDIQRCWTMGSILRLGPVNFIQRDVYEYVEASRLSFDLILCTGGLYHIPDPLRLLRGLHRLSNGYALIQSAVTSKHDDPGYYETPNPWFKTWGSLFTHSRLMRWIEEAGFEILESATDQREPPNTEGVGGSYALAKKP
jgi:SAM-dependent methyltransferase